MGIEMEWLIKGNYVTKLRRFEVWPYIHAFWHRRREGNLLEAPRGRPVAFIIGKVLKKPFMY